MYVAKKQLTECKIYVVYKNVNLFYIFWNEA